MGRPPCCDKVGFKKGPWTPEEDIILVSYIQEHGPGNWRAVPTNTGLMRCSKSCRLRWTNYLRPGIKRGNFTSHEEGMIVHLQALLGNKWAAIATYLPQRTDNDIKNYWNTHLKKKLKKFQTSDHQFVLKSYGERVLDNNLRMGVDDSSVYASSAENISRLLEGWMRSSSPLQPDNTSSSSYLNGYGDFDMLIPNDQNGDAASAVIHCYRPLKIEHEVHQDLEGMLSFDHHTMTAGMACDKSSCVSSQKGSENSGVMDQEKAKLDNDPPLSFLEKWLLDETAGQVEEVMELPLPPIF